ncbi:class I SAM-dependent methyltransferase [Streptomyces tubbatahanensis]|uniref:class I SAM-dependent methyltransferase n=1 Tax=Streptomyces tubbatahanensis TaxID=2923272 RepID=UPI00237CDA88|nr:class I SAM-dependent methyltransferase [Streptomyces tubbatahanensis]
MHAAAWDTYGRTRPARREVNAHGDTTWFNWTQHADHGPGVEVLQLPTGGDRVLDLGCGEGGNAAHLATLGYHVEGIDISRVQLAAARGRWGHLPNLRLHQEDAVRYLTDTDAEFGSVFSVFGAVWFTDPAVLLPLIRRRLRPGGVLGFSQRPPVEGCYGCQASYIDRGPDQDPHVVRR